MRPKTLTTEVQILPALAFGVYYPFWGVFPDAWQRGKGGLIFSRTSLQPMTAVPAKFHQNRPIQKFCITKAVLHSSTLLKYKCLPILLYA